MLVVDPKLKDNLVHKVAKEAAKGAVKPLMFDKYMNRVLKERFNNLNPEDKKYPKKVLLPRSMDEMLRGDLSPSDASFTMEQPLDIEGMPIWFGNSTDGVDIHMGTENGDSRFPCMEEFSDTTIHMLLAGSTGSGKSVALNDLIYAMTLQYAPWEINLIMSDAKIVSFKAYAKGHQLPHISAIAATGDSDYLISVLKFYHDQMLDLNTVFTNAGQGITNIMEFREETGIVLPRNMIVMDEFQTMFKTATNKQKKLIADMIDGFSRLGRNTGYHLILCSQELDSNISKGTLNQIKIRAALGCGAEVSEKILGNDMARYNDGLKGRCIMNTKPSEKDNKQFNKEFRVPYLPSDQVELYSSAMEYIGSVLGYKRPLTFYDETAVTYESDYPEYIHEFEYKQNTLYLGEPSRLTDDFPRVQKIEYTGRDTENITILTHVPSAQLRQVKMLKYNIARNKKATNIVLYSDKQFYDETGLAELSGNMSKQLHESFENPTECRMYQAGVKASLNDKKLMCKVDNKVFSDNAFTEEGDELFEIVNERQGLNNSKIYRSRCAYLMEELMISYKQSNRKSSLVEDDMVAIRTKAGTVLRRWKGYGINEDKAEPHVMPITYIWLLGLDKVMTIGRDNKTTPTNELKSLMQDGSKYNMRFITVASRTGEGLTFLKNCSRWFIFEGTDDRDTNRIATDSYPLNVPGVLSVLFDMEQFECFKYKKMFFDGEPLKAV